MPQNDLKKLQANGTKYSVLLGTNLKEVFFFDYCPGVICSMAQSLLKKALLENIHMVTSVYCIRIPSEICRPLSCDGGGVLTCSSS